ncbi:hypothetical protein ACJJTC_009891 [Scirpophaga incertulas]
MKEIYVFIMSKILLNFPPPLTDSSQRRAKECILTTDHDFSKDSNKSTKKRVEFSPSEDSNNIPIEDSFNIPTVDSNNIPIEDSNNIPIEDSFNIPTVDSNNIPIEDSNNIPIEDSFNIPTVDCNNIPIEDSNNIPVEDLFNIPTVDSNNIPIEDSNNIPIEDSLNIPAVDSNNIPIEDLFNIPIEDSNNIPKEDSFNIPVEDSFIIPEEESLHKIPKKNSYNIPAKDSFVIPSEETVIHPQEDSKLCLKSLFNYVPFENSNEKIAKENFKNINLLNCNKNIRTYKRTPCIIIDKLSLKPRCEQIVHLKISNFHSNFGIINKAEIADGVFIANCIVKINNGKVITSVLNTSDKSITVNNLLIDIEAVSDDEICFEDNYVTTQINKLNVDKLSNSVDPKRLEIIKSKLRTSHLNKEEKDSLEKIYTKIKVVIFHNERIQPNNDEIEDILKEYHSNPIGGHSGFHKTYK